MTHEKQQSVGTPVTSLEAARREGGHIHFKQQPSRRQVVRVCVRECLCVRVCTCECGEDEREGGAAASAQ